MLRGLAVVEEPFASEELGAWSLEIAVIVSLTIHCRQLKQILRSSLHPVHGLLIGLKEEL